jgi:hypothetical protein
MHALFVLNIQLSTREGVANRKASVNDCFHNLKPTPIPFVVINSLDEILQFAEDPTNGSVSKGKTLRLRGRAGTILVGSASCPAM